MTPRDKFIGSCAVVEFLIRHMERELAEGGAEALDAGLSADALEHLRAGRAAIRRAHRLLEEFRALAAGELDAPDANRSGGSADDKDDPEPEPEPQP